MDKLENCPNCGGTLEDTGRCRFCGSKIYDFVNVDFDQHTKTYIRIRNNGKIITMPVVFSVGSITTDYAISSVACDGHIREFANVVEPIITGSIDYTVVGDVITEKETEQ